MSWVLTELDESQTYSQIKITRESRQVSVGIIYGKLEPVWRQLIRSEYIREVTTNRCQCFNNWRRIWKFSRIYRRGSKPIQKLFKMDKKYQGVWAKDVQKFIYDAYHMFDPHTVFMNMKEKEKFDQAMNNEFVGIGARLQMKMDTVRSKSCYQEGRLKLLVIWRQMILFSK